MTKDMSSINVPSLQALSKSYLLPLVASCLKPEGLAYPLPGSKAPVTSTSETQRPEGPTHLSVRAR